MKSAEESNKVAKRREAVTEFEQLTELKERRSAAAGRRFNVKAEAAKREHDARFTPERRALLARRIRITSATTGGVLMIGAGAWSAVGVHAAVTAGAIAGMSASVMGWMLEPILLTAVAGIMIVRNFIALAGGRLHPGMWAIELAILGISVAANIKALPANPTTLDYVIRLTGPLFCLLISTSLGAIDRAIVAIDLDVKNSATNAPANSGTAVFADSATNAMNALLARAANGLDAVSTNGANTAAANSENGRRGHEQRELEEEITQLNWSDADYAQLRSMLDGGEPPLYPSSTNGDPANGLPARKASANGSGEQSGTGSRTTLAEYVELARERFANSDLPGPRKVANTIGCSPSTATKVIARLKEPTDNES